jgi:hypothetical protein
MVDRVLLERDILASSDNKHVVKLMYSFDSNEHVYLVMEFMPGGDLATFLRNIGYFEEKMAKRFYFVYFSFVFVFCLFAFHFCVCLMLFVILFVFYCCVWMGFVFVCCLLLLFCLFISRIFIHRFLSCFFLCLDISLKLF